MLSAGPSHRCYVHLWPSRELSGGKMSTRSSSDVARVATVPPEVAIPKRRHAQVLGLLLIVVATIFTPMAQPARAATLASDVVFVVNGDIWIRHATDGSTTRLTLTGSAVSPDVSPDDSKIVYLDFDPNPPRQFIMWVVNIDGSGAAPLDPETQNAQYVDSNPRWSPDGSQITFGRQFDQDLGVGLSGQGYAEIFVIDSDGSNIQQLTQSVQSFDPTWSPDGNRIAYTTGPTGDQLMIMNKDGSNSHSATSIVVPFYGPDWSPDGSRIYGRSTDGIAYIGSSDAFRTSTSTPIVQVIPPSTTNVDQWARVSGDGQSLVFSRTVCSATACDTTFTQSKHRAARRCYSAAPMGGRLPPG